MGGFPLAKKAVRLIRHLTNKICKENPLMSISRRTFIRAGAVIALAAGLPLKIGLAAAGQQTPKPAPKSATRSALPPPPAVTQTDSLVYYTKATFESYLNSSFMISSKRTQALDVKLVEVKDIGPVPDQQVAGKECFSLLFRGPSKRQQDTYTIKNGALGAFQLFLVPAGNDKKGYYLRAIINRLN
jgi:Domain of unknown function (DUF6916)